MKKEWFCALNTFEIIQPSKIKFNKPSSFFKFWFLLEADSVIIRPSGKCPAVPLSACTVTSKYSTKSQMQQITGRRLLFYGTEWCAHNHIPSRSLSSPSGTCLWLFRIRGWILNYKHFRYMWWSSAFASSLQMGIVITNINIYIYL